MPTSRVWASPDKDGMLIGNAKWVAMTGAILLHWSQRTLGQLGRDHRQDTAHKIRDAFAVISDTNLQITSAAEQQSAVAD